MGIGIQSIDVAGQQNLPAGVAGDVLYNNGTNWVVLNKGTALQQLRINAGATAPEWEDGLPSGTAGDIIYYNGSAWVSLAKGTGLQYIRMNAGATAPEWATLSAGVMKKQLAAVGSAANASETELETVTFTPNDEDNVIIVIASARCKVGGGDGSINAKVRFSDGTNNHDVTFKTGTSNASGHAIIFFGRTRDISPAEQLGRGGFMDNAGTISSAHATPSASINSGFMASNITLSLRAGGDSDDLITYSFEVLEMGNV